jgi:hypothetical protein
MHHTLVLVGLYRGVFKKGGWGMKRLLSQENFTNACVVTNNCP